MKKFEGTKGKWVYNENRDTHDSIIYSENAKEEYGYISNENGGVVGSSEWIWLKPEDAYLIASAPELLEALQDLVKYCEDNNVGAELELAKNVIDKAIM
jgi:hypothetical protein|tara:strand:- start:1444 stop:1740 length:297 start_codon:yes stop_codon:yes gene_type:complete